MAHIETNQAVLDWVLFQESVQPFSLDRQFACITACTAATAAAARGASPVSRHPKITRHVRVFHCKSAALASSMLRCDHCFGLDQSVHCAVGEVGAGGEAQSHEVVALV